MAFDIALNIISDAAAELGLGTVVDAYGSTDANIIQLRGLLKSTGRDLVRDRDWTHLVKEYSFVTWPNWAASTSYTDGSDNGHNPLSWAASSNHTVGDFVFNTCDATLVTANTVNGGSALYKCTKTGTAASSGAGPTGIGTGIADGTCTWSFVNQGTGSVVTRGKYYYSCSGPDGGGTSGTVGPVRPRSGTETDGTLTWAWLGNCADYALPPDFSNMLDQTGWNRTNRLPMGGPVDGQTWQYLKGRQQGVVFNVLFRPVANMLRLYPDTDTPGGYNIVFEYVSSWWAGTTGSTAPTMDAPTANTDIIYFDSLLMMRGLKLAWLKAKGFPTEHAQEQYDQCFEESANADGSAPVLNLAGRGSFDPLVGVQNIPITGFGS